MSKTRLRLALGASISPRNGTIRYWAISNYLKILLGMPRFLFRLALDLGPQILEIGLIHNF